jgi:hypothetical protein
MGQRQQLQVILRGILGTSNVYFQPPPSVKMAYPCIVYQRDDAQIEFAGNRPYSYTQRYQVTLIDENPDSLIRAKIAALPMVSVSRFFAVSGLNHDVFVLYF